MPSLHVPAYEPKSLAFYSQIKLHARIQKIFSGGVQIPRRGLTENFNMAKINNLAIPGGGGGGENFLRGGPNSQKGSDGKFQHGQN